MSVFKRIMTRLRSLFKRCVFCGGKLKFESYEPSPYCSTDTECWYRCEKCYHIALYIKGI